VFHSITNLLYDITKGKWMKDIYLFAAGKLVQQEDRVEGAVTLETYKTYMKSAGGQ